jgi:hypothetical protein
MIGDASLFQRADSIEAGWRVVRRQRLEGGGSARPTDLSRRDLRPQLYKRLAKRGSNSLEPLIFARPAKAPIIIWSGRATAPYDFGALRASIRADLRVDQMSPFA